MSTVMAEITAEKAWREWCRGVKGHADSRTMKSMFLHGWEARGMAAAQAPPPPPKK